MSTQPFQDGFPNQAQAAINASYFLSNEDRSEWFEWLKTADEQQQDELINILHTMWEDAQKQNLPKDNFTSQSIPPQTQQSINHNQNINSQEIDYNIVQPMANAVSSIENQQPDIVASSVLPAIEPQQPVFSLDKTSVETISQPKFANKDLETDQIYKPSAAIIQTQKDQDSDSFEFDTIEDIQSPANQSVLISKNTKNEVPDTLDEIIENSENNSQVSSKKLSNGGIDFVSIRSNVKKEDILLLKSNFVNTRESQEKSLNEFVEKVTTVICEFEEVNDYIEAMTDKVLTINDEVISQAQDIQDLKNQTQNRGGSLQDQIDEVKYDVEKILKEIRNIRIEIKRSNDEIRSRLSILEADSYRAENDGINQKLSVIKSELSKLQDAHTTGSQPQTFSEQFKSRSSKLDTIKFQK